MAEYKLSYTAQQIDEKLGEINNVVKYTQQTLTDEQKAQARENISAVSIEEVEELLGNTLKNLPNPVDDGDAVSKLYLEERLAAIEAKIAESIVNAEEVMF